MFLHLVEFRPLKMKWHKEITRAMGDNLIYDTFTNGEWYIHVSVPLCESPLVSSAGVPWYIGTDAAADTSTDNGTNNLYYNHVDIPNSFFNEETLHTYYSPEIAIKRLHNVTAISNVLHFLNHS